MPGVLPGRVLCEVPLTLLPAVLQMLQRLCGRVQEEVRALRLCPLEPVQDELLYARDLIKDAKNSRAVSPAQYPTYSPWQSRTQEASHAIPEVPGPCLCICTKACFWPDINPFLTQLFPSLYELGHVLANDGPVRQRLESVASEVSKAVDKELQASPGERV